MDTPIPEEFKDMARGLPYADGEALLASLETEPVVSIKFNRRKAGRLTAARAEELSGYRGLVPVEWCPDGFYLPERPKFTLNPLLHAGTFYVQEAGSMIYGALVEELCADMPPGLALDMCAAPGGKTTSIINALPDGWTVVANEYVGSRAAVLRENLLKWGYPDIIVTNNDTAPLAAAGPLFSLIAVDAPCSGEGMMRKEPVARSQWSPALVDRCAALQRSILADAVEALLPGGVLIYSTCTFNTIENDDNARLLIEEHGLEPVVTRCSALTKSPSQWPLRFLPSLSENEGLFVATFRKPGILQAPRNGAKVLEKMTRRCRVIADGYPAPVLKGRDMIPDPTAPLNVRFEADKYPVAELDLDTALEYLRHNAISLAPDAPRGLTVATYRGQRLGFVKNLGPRANNLYPKEWRIRNL